MQIMAMPVSILRLALSRSQPNLRRRYIDLSKLHMFDWLSELLTESNHGVNTQVDTIDNVSVVLPSFSHD
jgi:hypothetical protein